ncbi:MAG: hypothetical protein PVH77_09005 [Phycisphaerales bacterium]|jgi:hypothetical protein
MIKKLTPLLLLLSLCVITSVNAQNIIWVAMDWDADSDGVNDSQEWVDMLTDEGYTIDFRQAYWDELTEDLVAELNTADLVIVSATTQSGVLTTDAEEAELWNSVTAPMMLCCTYALRNSRWNWVDNGDAELPNNNGDQGSPLMQVIEPGHPIFEGISLDENNQVQIADPTLGSGQCTFIGTADAGNGTLIAKTVGNEWIWIAEWEEGVEFYNGADTYATNLRMTFSIGGHEVEGNGRDVNPARGYNLTDQGYRLFLNAIQYMLGISITPGKAGIPKPVGGTTDVSRDVVLGWRPGVYTATHNVYFGMEFNDVNEASVTDTRGVLVSQNQSANSYDPPGLLDWNQTYYWRVDEVNEAEPNSPWKGNVWSFTILNHYVVEDFEDYNDYPPDRIFDTWVDGWGTTTNGATAGYPEPDFNAGEHFVETQVVHNGEQSLPYFYDNDMKYSEAERPLTDEARDWTRDGVQELSVWFRGYLPEVGSFTEEPAGTYTMTATGEDIWGNSDAFHFAYRELTGVGSIIAKVESVEQTDVWAKAGVMIRNTLEPGSRHAMVVVTPQQGVSFQRRTVTSGESTETTEAEITAPQWVKIERDISGDFTASYSSDGISWTQIGLDSINMNLTAYVGLVVTAHNPIEVCQAVFSNVSITGTVTDQWTNQDIGILSNSPQPMYMAVSNSTGEPAVIYNEDTSATVIPTWTEFIVPLQDFADLGVDLTDVDNIAIGVGTRGETTTLGGTGKLYFDDIRLYLPRESELESEPEPAP